MQQIVHGLASLSRVCHPIGATCVGSERFSRLHASSPLGCRFVSRPSRVDARLFAVASQTQGSLETAITLSPMEREYYREVRPELAEYLNAAAPCDFFELLNVDSDASAPDIRSSYRALQRIVHPDVVGDAANEIAVILNLAYATLMNESARDAYAEAAKRFRREGHMYDGRPVSKWMGDESEQRAVFVDETACVGCRHCTYCAPNTFSMEEHYGRARVHTQWGDDQDDIKEAVDMCPVDCINYVSKDQLALLEFVLKFCPREDTAIMARRRSGNMGSKPSKQDPFARAESWLRQRRDAKIDLRDASLSSLVSEESAALMARAWLALPQEIRQQGWPSIGREERVAYF